MANSVKSQNEDVRTRVYVARIDKSKEIMTRQLTNELVTYRMRHARPIAWEEDLSRNALDESPFDNNPAPAQRNPEDFEKKDPRADELYDLLGDRSLKELIVNDGYAIPSFDDRERYARDDTWYWLNGLRDFLKVMQVVDRHGLNPQSYFDFGCASGRVLRHFAAQTEIPEIWGSDINRRHIRWLYEHMPRKVKPVFNHCIPSLPIRDNSVDLITAFSVFTHIDTFETCWLAELSRIMNDDGLCYLTVHDENTWELLRDQVDNQNNRLIQSMLDCDPEVAMTIHKPLKDGRSVYRFSESGPYRAQVFHSARYLQNVWGRFFEIEEVLPGHHVWQTVLVLRKRR